MHSIVLEFLPHQAVAVKGPAFSCMTSGLVWAQGNVSGSVETSVGD